MSMRSDGPYIIRSNKYGWGSVNRDSASMLWSLNRRNRGMEAAGAGGFMG